MYGQQNIKYSILIFNNTDYFSDNSTSGPTYIPAPSSSAT